MNSKRLASVLIAGVLFCAWLASPQPASRADVVPFGPQFQVDDNTNFPDLSAEDPAVARRDGGRFVVVWRRDLSSIATRVLGRIFEADGSPIGDSILLVAAETSSPFGGSIVRSPEVGQGPDGGFAVVADLETTYITEHNNYISARRYDADGNPLGGLPTNALTLEQSVAEPAVSASDASGSFVVTWSHYGYPGFPDASGAGVFAHRSGAGNSTFQVNTYTDGDQILSAIARGPDGHFLVVWQSAGQDGSGLGVYGQAYDADANPVGGERPLAQTTAGDQRNPDVAVAPDGTFTVVWQDASSGERRVFGRRFAADGSPLGNVYLVSGGMLVDDLENALRIELSDRDEDTVGGVVLSELGRLPAAGDRVELGPVEIEVLGLEGNRITAVRVTVKEPAPAGA